MTKGILFSDLHASNVWSVAKQTDGIGTDRLEDALDVMDQITKHAIKERVKFVAFLGDFFDKRVVDTVTMNAVSAAVKRMVDRLEEIGAELIIVAGNHDASDNRNVVYSTDVYEALDMKGVSNLSPKSPLIISDGGYEYAFWGIPYAKREPWVAAHRSILENDHYKSVASSDGLNILLFHGDVIGATDHGWVCDEGATTSELAAFDRAYSGHFHQQQEFPSPARGMYLGAAMPHDFGDDPNEMRGFWVIALEDGRTELEHHQADAPKFITLKVEADGDIVPNQIMKRLLKSGHDVDGNYVRIVWTTTPPVYGAIDRQAISDSIIASGARKVKHQPDLKYHHKQRIDVSGVPTFGEMVRKYVDDDGVEKGALDASELAKIGMEIVQHCAMDGRHGADG